jgi:hypothetical protein
MLAFLAAAAVATIATFATAQSPNLLEIYSGTTNAASRGGLGAGAGEIHQGFHGSHWGSIGDGGRLSSIAGFTYVVQDQNLGTSETYDLVVRSGTDTAGPTPGTAGELGVVAGLTTPIGSPGSGAFLVTTDFATPIGIPQKGFFAVGIGLSANAGWPQTDGQTNHTTFQVGQQSGFHQDDHAWQIIGGVTTHPNQLRSWRIALRLAAPVLQNGSFATGTANFARGMGGLFPPLTSHGWSTHINAGSTFADGFAAIFLGPALSPLGLPVGGISGSLCLDPRLIVPFPLFNLNGSGALNVAIVDPVRPFRGARIYLQAACASRAFAVSFTNAAGTSFW